MANKKRYRMRNPYVHAEQFTGPSLIRAGTDFPTDAPKEIVWIQTETAPAGMWRAAFPHPTGLFFPANEGCWIVTDDYGNKYLFNDKEFNEAYRPAMEPVT